MTIRATALALAAGLGVLMIAPVSADHVHPYKDASRVLQPPERFIREYNHRAGSFVRVFDTHANVIRACGLGQNILACAKRKKWSAKHQQYNWCRVFMPNNMPPALERAVRIHERAHCLGWSHNGQTGPVTSLVELEDGSLSWIEVEGLHEDYHLHDHEADE